MTVQSTTKAENKNEIFECTSTFLPFFREIGYGTNKWFFLRLVQLESSNDPFSYRKVDSVLSETTTYSSKIAESRLRYGIKIQLPPMVLLYSRLYRRRNNTCI